MKNTSRMKVLGLLGLPLIALAVVAVLLSMSLGSGGTTKVSAADPGTDFSINVRGNATCTTNGGDTKCTQSQGSVFVVEVVLKSLPTGVTSYSGFDLFITYSGITSVNNPSSSKWPDSAFPASIIGTGNVRFGNAIGVSAPMSTYTGPLGTLSFNCDAPQGLIHLVHSATDTNVDQHFDKGGTNGQETLTINCATATPPPTATPTPTPPPVPRWVKVDLWAQAKKDALVSSTNLFLTRQGTKIPPSRCEVSTDQAAFGELLTLDPNPLGTKGPFGAFSFEVRYNPKLVCVNLIPLPPTPSIYPVLPPPQGWMCIIDDKDQGQVLDGIARMACVTKGKNTPPLANHKNLGPMLAILVVQPQPEVYSQIIPNQDNGIPLKLLDQDCKLSDDQGHTIPIFSCEDANLTLRYLEGDVEPDCTVNALDQQIVAFAWGARKGSLLYSQRLDLEPSGTVKGDGDVDIRDLQAVFGRHGSRCNQWNNRGYKGPSWPLQLPANPN